MKVPDMTQPKKFKLKKDRFTGKRGGSSKFLVLRCAACREKILLYQKDGPGNLFRLYRDKIHAPDTILQQTTAGKLPALKCQNCGKLLALPMVYKKEGRAAYRLIKGMIHTERSNGLF